MGRHRLIAYDRPDIKNDVRKIRGSIRNNPVNPDAIRTDKNKDNINIMAISMNESKTESNICPRTMELRFTGAINIL